MTESIFDPNSGETERSGSTFMPADADQISHMPPDVIDGRVDDDEEENADEQDQEVGVEPGLGAAAEQERQIDLEASDSRRFQSQGEAKEEVAELPDDPQ